MRTPAKIVLPSCTRQHVSRVRLAFSAKINVFKLTYFYHTLGVLPLPGDALELLRAGLQKVALRRFADH